MTKHTLFLAAALGLLAGTLTPQADARIAPRPTGVIGVDNNQPTPVYWIDRQRHADRVVLDRGAIALQNRELQQPDPSMHDVESLPAELDAARVREWIEDLSSRPQRQLYDVQGKPVPDKAIDGFVDALNLKAIPGTQETRYGLVVHRADLRTFPTTTRVFSSDDDTDIDRFQESALFPGTPVAIVHESADKKWWRSEERRLGKEWVSTCRYRGSPYHEKKKKQKEYLIIFKQTEHKITSR